MRHFFLTMTAAAFASVLTYSLAGERETLPAPLPAIAENAGDQAKIALGRRLFFDPRLSRDNTIACATCHDPAKGFSNGERFAKGVGGALGTRNVPTLVNVGMQKFQFWDGRAQTLEEQALAPIVHPKEMNMDLEALTRRLESIAEYKQAFAMPPTTQTIAQALAAFERTIVSNDTPFDRYLKGDKRALPESATRGLTLFFGEARCSLCHRGANLTDDDFHNVGVPQGQVKDSGRQAITGKKADFDKFKTPTLREVARTFPYMHNGHFKTLKEVVQHYNFGGVTDEANDHRDEKLSVLYLDEAKVDDIVAFLRDGLTSPTLMKRFAP